MQNHKSYKIALLFLPFLLLSGCASTTAPRGWLPSNSQTQSQTFGSWIQVHYNSDSDKDQFIDGELIALDTDTLYILTDQRFQSIAKPDITKARLVSYDSKAGSMGGLVFLGTLSTLSHGAFLILTAPFLWMIGGGATAASQSLKPIIDYPDRSLEDFQHYARFPQGLPRGISLAKLKPKLYSISK